MLTGSLDPRCNAPTVGVSPARALKAPDPSNILGATARVRNCRRPRQFLFAWFCTVHLQSVTKWYKHVLCEHRFESNEYCKNVRYIPCISYSSTSSVHCITFPDLGWYTVRLEFLISVNFPNIRCRMSKCPPIFAAVFNIMPWQRPKRSRFWGGAGEGESMGADVHMFGLESRDIGQSRRLYRKHTSASVSWTGPSLNLVGVGSWVGLSTQKFSVALTFCVLRPTQLPQGCSL